MSLELLRAETLSKRFGPRLALDAVDLTLSAGESVAAIGANGAGKSTLLSLLAGAAKPDRGSIRVRAPDGRWWSPADPAYRGRLGYAPQARRLFPDLTVSEQLVLLASIHGASRSEAKARAKALIAALSLESHAGARGRSLSGGMARRAQLGLAAIHAPAVLLLDEPLESLDPASRSAVLDLVAVERARGAAVLWTSHELGEVEAAADRVLVLHRGRLRRAGRPGELLAVRDWIAALEFEPLVALERAAIAARFLPFPAAWTGDGLQIRLPDRLEARQSFLGTAAALEPTPRMVVLRPRTLQDTFLELSADE